MVPVVSPPGTSDVPRPVRRARRLLIAGTLCVASLVLIVALLAPTFRRQRAYAALLSHGVTTEAHVAYCSSTVGSNLTFSGGITCLASFEVHGVSITEHLLGVPAPLATGAQVTVEVDPHDVTDVYPLRDVRTGYHSGWLTNDTLIAALAALLLLGTITSQVVVERRRRCGNRSAASTGGGA